MPVELLPSLGAAGALVVVIGYLLSSNRADRTQQALTNKQNREEIAQLKADTRTLQTALDYERELRRNSEDTTAKIRIEVSEVKAHLETLLPGANSGEH